MTTITSSSSCLPRKRKASCDSTEGGKSDNAEDAKNSESASATHGVGTKNPSTIHDSRLPSKKRRGSLDAKERQRSGSLDISRRKDSHESATTMRKRKGSQDSSVQFADQPKPSRKASADYSESILNGPRKSSNDLSVQFQDEHLLGRKLSDVTMPNIADVPRKESGDSSLKLEELLAIQPIDEKVQDAASLPDILPVPVNAMEHLNTLEAAKPPPSLPRKEGDGDSQSSTTFGSVTNKLLVESISGGATLGAQLESMKPRGRDRLESWGGMSDLSMPVGSDGAAATALAFSIQAKTGDEDSKLSSVASQGRERLNSLETRPRVNSLGDAFIRERSNTLGSLADLSFSGLTPTENSDSSVMNSMEVMIAAKVAASFGDQLEELAADVETAAETADPELLKEMRREMGVESDAESAVAPMIGTLLDGGRNKGRPRSMSASSGQISVDLDAVKAAVSATANLEMAKIVMKPPAASVTQSERPRNRRQLPLRSRANSGVSAASDDRTQGSFTESGKKRLIDRARQAGNSSSVPFKKRVKRLDPEPQDASSSNPRTPKHSNRKVTQPPSLPPVPLIPESGTSSSASKGQPGQKWEGMYECLLEFVEEKRREATAGLSDSDAADWQWDGNVPTTYKTSDGKNLGRWVNNQRSSHSKGKLKADRADRLSDAGLKWSVLTSNSWNEMLSELRKYIEEQSASGISWDGNVPTNYQIKTDHNSKFAGEDKNLGRWVNRQRSLFRSGKLRKDRQADLEAIGLKWSMLSTNSWEVMFDTLCAYIEERKTQAGGWGGNVPANYRTSDVPPRALGRWINRQRSAYAKNILKSEYVDKLNALGLKWSVHDRDGNRQNSQVPSSFSSAPAPTSSSTTPVETLSLDDKSPVGPSVAAG